MGNDKPISDPEDLFLLLLEGRIPDCPPLLPPDIYAGVLIRAIRAHKNLLDDAVSELRYDEECMEWISELMNDPEYEFALWDCRLLYNAASESAELRKEQIQVAKGNMEMCESLLLDLMERYPDLKDKL